MSSGSETTLRTRMRPPHLRQTVTSTAKTRARRAAHARRRGLGDASAGSPEASLAAPARSNASCSVGDGTAAGGTMRAEVMVAREHPEVPGHVETRRGHERTQSGEELVRGHVGVGDAAAPRGLEEDADSAARERLHGVVGEGRPQHVAAHPLELLAVAAVDGGRGVQVHVERKDRQQRPGRGLGRWDRVWAGERELHAGGEGRVHVEVIILGDGGEGLVELVVLGPCGGELALYCFEQ